MASPVPIRRAADATLAKQLPHNLEAERSVLGAVLLNNTALAPAAKLLRPTDFFLSQHRLIFEKMLRLDEAGIAIDAVTLMERLQANGEIEAAGGVAYLSSLADGLPRVTNVPHYAAIVADKGRLRDLIQTTELIQARAMDSGADAMQLAGDLADYTKRFITGRPGGLVQVDFRELLTMTLPPRDFVIEPLLSDRGRGLVYSPRGAGKTFITLQMACDVAAGNPESFMWHVPRARPVTYVDGEMSVEELQERLRHIARMTDGRELRWPEEKFLKIVARDLQKEARPNIITRDGRRRIEDTVEPGCLLILDNIASLGQSSDEKETEDWAMIEDWASDLCWRGISVIFIHHAGKSGDQRGSSKREDLMEFVLKLKIPGDYSPEQGLRVEAHLTKKRGKLTHAKYGQPFEISLALGGTGFPEWTMRPLWKLLRERAAEMLATGMKPNDVAQETGLSRYAIYRIKQSNGKLPEE